MSIGLCCCYLFFCKSYRSRLAKRGPNKKVELSASGSVTKSLENSYVKGMHQFNYILRNVIYNNNQTIDINTPNVKAEFIPLISNMLILNWQLRLMDVIGQGVLCYIIIMLLISIQCHAIIIHACYR